MSRFVDDIYLRGAGLSKQLIEAVTSCTMDGSLTDINQIAIDFIDPGWKILNSGIFSLNASVSVEDFEHEIASIDTGDQAGVESVTIKCRSKVIRKLKNRRGTRVMKNASPSEFIISECKAVGAKYKVQSSAKRKQVARDTPKKGAQEVETPPSSWTTFNRLADEIGYICFETAGVIYFGRPSYFISEGAINETFLTYHHKSGADDDHRTYSVPSGTRSVDSPGQSVQFDVHVASLKTIRTGMRFHLEGVPTFDTNYLVTRFSIDMTDPRKLCSITGGVALNPNPSEDAGKQERRGTRLASDFVYWVQKQIGNKYVSNTQTALGAFDPNTFDGDELVQWAAAQVGVYMPETANNQIEYCESFGTTVSLATGIKTRGAILWRDNHIGIVVGNDQVIESIGGKVGIKKGGAASRYKRAGKIPSLLY